MTHNHNHNHSYRRSSDFRSSTGDNGSTHQRFRRVLAAFRRFQSDVMYLNERQLERPY